MKKPPTICLIDDEVTLRDVVRRYLEHEGYHVIEIESSAEALTLLQQTHIDLILLDIMLPVLDGFTLLRVLQHSPDYQALNADVPIIMLTSRGEESDRIAGFDLGVDDYVVKPFSVRELTARVKAVLRRVQDVASDIPAKPLIYGDFQIDERRRTVQIGERMPSLKAREFDLLWLLASHPRQVFTREQLLKIVWGIDYAGDDSTVTVHIRRVREKIEIDAANPAYIQTIWGVGYKFEP